MKMNKKAEELIEKLQGMADAQATAGAEESGYDVGDIISVNHDGQSYAATVEAIEEDSYYVRIQAVAGDEFEATDKVIKVTEADMSEYEKPKSFNMGDKVSWKSEAGEVVGLVVGQTESGLHQIEVYVKDAGEYVPTRVVVDIPTESLSRVVAEFKEVRDKLLCKMDSITVEYDTERKVGIIEGMASTYGNVDLGGDTVAKGAYTQTLNHKSGRVQLFTDHGWTMDTYMGVAFLEDSATGLKMRGEMALEATDVKNVFAKIQFAMERGEQMGLSIGYDAVKSQYNSDGTRTLKEIALHEVSVTPFPMDTHARILSARSKRVAYKSMQAKWQSIQIDAPATGNQDEQGALALVELKSLITTKRKHK
jgi:HK97 family phage prohead protease